MSIHDEGKDRDRVPESTSERDDEIDEAADFVHPVDHGHGIDEEPVETERAGSYVSGGDHPKTAERVIAEEEKGDFVYPVDHGSGSRDNPDEDAGDYTESDHGKR